MKVKLTNNYFKWRGFSTLELLIAFSIVTLALTSIVVLIFGSQSMAGDSQTVGAADDLLINQVQKLRDQVRVDFGSLASSSAVVGEYTTQTAVNPAFTAECSRQATTTVAWHQSAGISIGQQLLDTFALRALGGNCDTEPPIGSWKMPSSLATIALPFRPAAFDVFNGATYIVATTSPFFSIVNSQPPFGVSTQLNESSGFNDIKLARLPDGKLYAFVARNASSSQLEILDVTDSHNPTVVASSSLAGVSSSGSYPEGWRLFYYDQKLYIVTRFTSGPELHIFDVSHPAAPQELGNKKLDRTVEDLIVTKVVVGGVTYDIAYMATDKNDAPLSIFNVTDPTRIQELTTAEPLFSVYQDGQTVFLLGDILYFGRFSSRDGDLFAYDASDPFSASPLPLLGKQDIGATVSSLTVSGSFIFLSSPKKNAEVQIYDSSPASMTKISSISVPKALKVRYTNNLLYAISAASSTLFLLKSP